MVAMSMKEKGCAIAYYPPGNKTPVVGIVPACKVEVKDATGAGDTFKVGLVAYVLEHAEAFKNECKKFGFHHRYPSILKHTLSKLPIHHHRVDLPGRIPGTAFHIAQHGQTQIPCGVVADQPADTCILTILLVKLECAIIFNIEP